MSWVAITTNEEPFGTLTLGISESLMICRVPALLVEYRRLYPQVKLSLKSLDYQDMNLSIQTGEIDLVLMLEKENWSTADLHCDPLIRERMVLISPPGGSFSEEPTALYTERSCSYKAIFNDYLNHVGMDVAGSMEFQSIEAIKQCVQKGLGISLVPYFSVKEELKNNKLRGEFIGDDRPAISTYLAYRKDKWISPAIRSMIGLVQKQSKDWE